MATADLVVRILTEADTKGIDGAVSSVDKAQGKFGKAGAALKSMAVPAGVALAGIVAFGKGAVDSASRVEQAMGAVDSVFGKNATQVKQWASESATSVGLSKSAYAEMATVLGAQLKNMGIPMDKVAGQTNDLIGLGADLAATYGGTTADAVEALSAALRGETDPIEKYGVSVKQADIAAQQAADGTDKLTGAAGKQAKTMALLKLVNKQTADAQGAFNRESDTAAHSAQVTAAQYEDMKATLGEALLPAISSVTAALGKLATFMGKHKTATTIVIAVIGAMAAAILVLNAAMTVYTAVTTLAASATLTAWIAAAWPILAVVAAVALVVVAIVVLWKKCAWFRNAVKAVWNAIKTAALAAWRAIIAGGKAMLNGLKAGWRALGAAAKSVWNAIKASAKATWDGIKAAARVMGSAVRAVWQGLKSAVKTVIDWIKAAWRAVMASVKSTAQTYINAVKTVINGVKSVVSDVVGKVRELISAMRGIKVPGAVQSALNSIKSAIDTVIGKVQDLIHWLSNIPTPHISWPSPPKWLDKVMPGMAPVPPVPGTAAYAAPAVPGARAGTTTRAAAGGITINVTGALDPEATARQIKRILAGHDRRVGLRVS